MPENYYTSREAAKLLGVSQRTAQLWLEKGLLAGWKTSGGHRRITQASVLQSLLESTNKRAKPYAIPLLIIEDDAALLKLYRLKMSSWPFDISIHSAPNGYEGLVMVGEVSPRLLICDLRLPGVNGFQIVRSLRNMDRYKDLAIVVVSGLPPDEISAHGGLPPGVEMMGKPIDFLRLQAITTDLRFRHCPYDQIAQANPTALTLSKTL
jgi:excisionase family DNA binding protein